MPPNTASVYFFLFVLHMTDSLASYYISEGKSVWSDQSKQCRSSTPEIVSCSDNRDKCSLKIDNDIDMQASDEGIWIGYCKTEMAFEYVGCVAENKIHKGQKCSFDKDPRRCYPECIGSTFIGLSKDKKYYCFDNSPHSNDLLSSSCDAVCKRPVKVACGGERGKNTYISLYKINPNVIGKIFSGSTEEGNDANCLKLSEERPEWEKWEKSHGTLCSSGNGTFNLSDKPDKSRNWFDAAKQCFKTGKYPISYSTASSPETFEDNSVWTGVFKMNIIYKQLQETSSGYMNSDIRYGYLSSDFYLRFTRENNTKRVLCEKGPIDTTTSSKNKDTKTTKSPPNTSSLSVTVSTITAVISVVVAIIIVAVLTVFLTKKRRMNQGTRLTEVGYVPEQTNNITPISEKARDGDYTTIQDIGTGKEIEIQNTQNIVYESLGERNYEEHGYETANTQTSVYESLGERHDEEHNYRTPTTHRSAYESLGERHDEEHGYGTPNTQRSSYESLGERRDEEHSYGVSTQARSGFHQPLEEEMVEAHNYKIAEQPRELAYDSLGDKIKETHCDKTSDQTAYVRPYEWVE